MALARSSSSSTLAPIVLNLLGASLALTGVLLTTWLWPDNADYHRQSAAPALTVLGVFAVAAVVCWTGAAIVRALGR